MRAAGSQPAVLIHVSGVSVPQGEDFMHIAPGSVLEEQLNCSVPSSLAPGARKPATYMCPEQLVCPHVQTISVLLAIPSQWALQYFELPSAGQLQAAFAHFLELAIVLLYRSACRFWAADRLTVRCTMAWKR